MPAAGAFADGVVDCVVIDGDGYCDCIDGEGCEGYCDSEAGCSRHSDAVDPALVAWTCCEELGADERLATAQPVIAASAASDSARRVTARPRPRGDGARAG